MARIIIVSDQTLTQEDWKKIISIGWTPAQRKALKLLQEENGEPVANEKLKEASGLSSPKLSINAWLARLQKPYRIYQVAAPEGKPLGIYHKMVIIENPYHRKPTLFPF